ncbi:nucleoside hydrolase [Ktedonospora formicarum]|uniref:Putative nucleoside hydrolase IunH n=1 Tax=Ktedonospora formicarum TaxID=2778364 RepID=A0A8J3MRU4_9CHLR|nr:nucleoside hydrolase [Ktedonospora formicarum]GHO43948.1 putative nucleoside hydrolase IunH [Ktedonospora formicarum]
MASPSASRIKVILDTDIGNNIDDAVCLAYLLAQSQCDLLGITTVTGEPYQRAMIASSLCTIAAQDIPIYPGVDRPLLTPIRQPQATQAVALTNWKHDTDFPRGQAIAFLNHTIRAYPGEIFLLGIGPLTNIALLFASQPDIPQLLKGLILMSGQFEPPGREWNVLNDPYAAAIVYRANVPIHRSIGLEITEQLRMPAAEFRARCTAPLLRPVRDFAEVWFQHQESIIFHDPLAATTIFDEHLCDFTPGTVHVELRDDITLGKTELDRRTQQPRHQVASNVNVHLFFERFFSVFS